jgi:DNA-binding transcriptional LysR family regulator
VEPAIKPQGLVRKDKSARRIVRTSLPGQCDFSRAFPFRAERGGCCKGNGFALYVSLMEIFELRYFLGVAQDENIHRASEKLRVSPASLSKAITRLEDELAIKLFQRDGRNIKLTDQGRLLQRRASEIVRLEEDARVEIGGHLGLIHIVIAGPEILLSKMGLQLSSTIKKKFPHSVFELHSTDDETAIQQVIRGEAHLAITTSDIPANQELSAKLIGEAKFHTFVGKAHPLYGLAKAKKAIAVEELLKYPFVSPTNPILGKVGLKQSLDGWRDDQFQRRVDYRTSSLKILEEFVVTGKAVAYLPDYFCENLNLEVLLVSGCPYSCSQKVRLVARNPKELSWLNQIF